MSNILVPPGTRITNHFNKETFVFTHPYDDQAFSQMDVILEAGGSGGGNAIEHIHPETDEIFTVQHGRLMISLDGVEHFVEAGQSATVQKGVPHFFRNAWDGETRTTIVFTNPQRHQRFFLNLATCASQNHEYFSPKGDAKLLPTALFLHAYRDHLYIAGPPVWLQKIMFSILAKVALLVGYRLAVHPKKPLASEDLAMAYDGVPAE